MSYCTVCGNGTENFDRSRIKGERCEGCGTRRVSLVAEFFQSPAPSTSSQVVGAIDALINAVESLTKAEYSGAPAEEIQTKKDVFYALRRAALSAPSQGPADHDSFLSLDGVEFGIDDVNVRIKDSGTVRLLNHSEGERLARWFYAWYLAKRPVPAAPAAPVDPKTRIASVIEKTLDGVSPLAAVVCANLILEEFGIDWETLHPGSASTGEDGTECPECHMASPHKLQCSRRMGPGAGQGEEGAGGLVDFIHACEDLSGDFGNYINTPTGHPELASDKLLDRIGLWVFAHTQVADDLRALPSASSSPQRAASGRPDRQMIEEDIKCLRALLRDRINTTAMRVMLDRVFNAALLGEAPPKASEAETGRSKSIFASPGISGHGFHLGDSKNGRTQYVDAPEDISEVVIAGHHEGRS